MRLHFLIEQNSGAFVNVSSRVVLNSLGTIRYALRSINGAALLSPPSSVKLDNRDGWWITTTEDAASIFYGAWANRRVQITVERDGLSPFVVGTFRIKPDASLEMSRDGFAELELEALAENLRRADASDVGYGRGWYGSIPWTVAFEKLRSPEDRSTLPGGLPDASRRYNGSNEYNRRVSSIGRPGDYRSDGFHEVFDRAIDVCYNETNRKFCYATHSELYEFDPVSMLWNVVPISFAIPTGCDILRIWWRKKTIGSAYDEFYLLLVAPREEATQNNGSGYYQPLDQKSERCNYAYFYAHNRVNYLVVLDDVCLAPVIYRGNYQNQSIPDLPYSEDFGGDKGYSGSDRCENLTIPFAQYVFAPIIRRRTAGDGTYYQDEGIEVASYQYIRYLETTSADALHSTNYDSDLGWSITPDTSFPVDQQLGDNDLRGGRGYYGIRITNNAPFGWNTLTTGGPRYSLGQGPMVDVSYSIESYYDPLSFFVAYVQFSEPIGAGTGQYTVRLAYVKGTTQTLYQDAGSSVVLAIGTVPTFVISQVNGYSNLKGYLFFGWYDYHGTASGGLRYARSGFAAYPCSAIYNSAAPDLSVTTGNLKAVLFTEATESGSLIPFTNTVGSNYAGRWTPVSAGFRQDFSGSITDFSFHLGILDRNEIEPSILLRRLGFPYRLLVVNLRHNVTTDAWTLYTYSLSAWRGSLPPMGWTRRLVGETYGDNCANLYFFSPGENSLYECGPGLSWHARIAATVPLTDQFLGVGNLATGNEDGDITKPRVCGVSSPVFPLTGPERWPGGQYEGWYYGERHSGRIPLLDNHSLSKWEAIRAVTEVGDSVYYLDRGGSGYLRSRPSGDTPPVLSLTKKDYSEAQRSWLPIENYVTRSLGDVVPADAKIRVILGPFSNWNLVPAISGFGARPLEVELKCIKGGLAYAGGNPWDDPNIGATHWAFKKIGKRVTTTLGANVSPGSSYLLISEVEDINVGDIVTLGIADEELVIDSILPASGFVTLDRAIAGAYEIGDLVWIEKADDNRWSASTELFTDGHLVSREFCIAQIVEDAAAGDARIKVNTIEPFGVGNLFAFANTSAATPASPQPWYRVTRVFERWEGDEALGGDPQDQWVEFVYVDPTGTYDPSGSPGLQSSVLAGEGIQVWITLPPGNRRAAIGNTGLMVAAIGQGTDAEVGDEKPVVEGDRIQIVYDGLQIRSNSHSKVTARDADSIAKYGKLTPKGLQANRYMDPYLAEIDVNWRVQISGEKRVHLSLSDIYRRDVFDLYPWDIVEVVDDVLLPDKANNRANFLVVGIDFKPSTLAIDLELDELTDPDDRARTRDTSLTEKLLPLAGFRFFADSPLYDKVADATSFYDRPTDDKNFLTQGTASYRPTFQTGERNGLPVLRFDGSDMLYGSNLGYFTNSRRDARGPGMTIFVVAKASAANQALLSCILTFSGFYQFYLRSSKFGVYDTKTGSGLREATFASFVAGEWAVFCGVYAPGKTVKVYYNGVLDGTSAGAVTDMEQGGFAISLGGEGSGSFWQNGDTGAAVIFPFELTVDEIDDFSDYLRAKWVDVPAAPAGSGHDSGFDDGFG